MTTLTLIRHGNTAWNTERRAQGCADIPLDETGILQGKKLAERLSSDKWHTIYSSDLLRAKQTAELISERLDSIDILYDPRLREVNGGLIEGTTEAERIAKWGPDWRSLDLGLEETEKATERGLSATQDILRLHAGKNILVISHGAIITYLLKEWLPSADWEAPMLNTSVTKLVCNDKGWKCLLFNCTAHL
ncbi:histidine phosphatase family protein [Bacillus sp. 1P06AnD]|uniref:histidine phosphatase family protein n=1 Tax=Bacillus sp. 1P06AnD TaxID=3132208 RepID=UPI0039A1FFA9